MATPTPEPAAPIVDAEQLGRLVRAARIMRGADTVKEAATMLSAAAPGYEISERALGAVERGEVKPTLEFLVVFVVTMSPPNGIRFFADAVREDVRERWLELPVGRY